MRKLLTTWEIWWTVYEDGGESATMTLRDAPEKMVFITENGYEKNVRLIHTFEAPTFNTASVIKHRLLKHSGKYVPMEGPDTCYYLDTETNAIVCEDVIEPPKRSFWSKLGGYLIFPFVAPFMLLAFWFLGKAKPGRKD